MSNRLRRMDRFEREEECRGERWAYIVYGLSADARTDSARLKLISWTHSRRAQRALLEQKPKLSLEDVKSRLKRLVLG